MITHTYASHSQFVDMVFDALENEKLDDDKEHKFDIKIKKFMDSYY